MTGDCPEDYDLRLLSLFYETIVATDAYKDKSAKSVFANGEIRGYDYYEDFMAAWEDRVLQQAIDTYASLSDDQRAHAIFDFLDDTAQRTLQDPLPGAISDEKINGHRIMWLHRTTLTNIK